MNRSGMDVLEIPVEVSIMRDGRPLMVQTFQHSPIRIGRILENDIVLPFDSVSRHHCELRFNSGKWILNDLKSMNGVKVAGEQVRSAEIANGGSFDLKPVTISIRQLQPAQHQDANSGETAPDFISPTDETLVGPDPKQAAGKRLHTSSEPASAQRPQQHAPSQEGAAQAHRKSTAKKPLLNVNTIELMSEPHPLAEKAKSRAVQVSVFWHDALLIVEEYLPGEDIIVEVNGIFLRLGRVGKDRSEVRCPNGTQFSNRPGRESILLPTTPVVWTADWGLSLVARYVPPSKYRRTGVVPFIEEELIDPMVISGLVHGAVAVANLTFTPKQIVHEPPPERVAKIIMPAPAPTPAPVAMATPTPTPPPTPTPIVAKATPTPAPTPKLQAKATPPPVDKKVPIKKQPPKVAKKEEAGAAPKADTDSKDKRIAKSNPPPPGPKTEAPLAPTPRPFNASSVGALKALSLLSAPAPQTANTERIVVRRTAANEDGGGSGSSAPSTSALMKDLPIVEGGSESGVAGGMALKVSTGGSGYGATGFSGKTGKRNVLGSVIGGASYTEIAKTEGLTREQVMKVVQKHHSQIQQCYERSLMDDPNLAGRAEFEWEISAQGSVSAVSVKETSLRNGDRLLDCVKGVFRGMKFPVAKNGSSTTPTIGLPFGRL